MVLVYATLTLMRPEREAGADSIALVPSKTSVEEESYTSPSVGRSSVRMAGSFLEAAGSELDG